MSIIVTHHRKPDKVDAVLVEARTDVLEEAAKWCQGVVIISYNDRDSGMIVESETAVKVPTKINSETGDVFEFTDARIGMYIVKYWETDDHDGNFHVFTQESFEAIYERD